MARPRRIEGEAATVRLSVRFTPSELRRLREVAESEGVPKAWLLREATNSYVADYGERRVFSPERPAKR